MRLSVFVFGIGIFVIQIFQESVAISGKCTCMCCIGSGCQPAILPSFSVDTCASCTDEACRAKYPDNCPSASAIGSTNSRCMDDTTTMTTTTKPNEPGGCFASSATVRLTNGCVKKMSDLIVGDSVFVKHNHKIIGSRILAVFHHYRNIIRFLDIYTAESITPLRLTPMHSLLVLPRNDTRERYLFAQDVSVGDFVFSSDLHPLRIIHVEETLIYNDSGYAPLTFEGNIIVDDIVASCYATYDHSTMHVITTPIRWWFHILYKFYDFLKLDYLHKLTTDIVVSFVDFYLQSIREISSFAQLSTRRA